ncbi:MULTISPECIES: hypothetical protein [unclassified Lysobacter]|nr:MULTISPECIES: hypothetical protein [unclassified Lysobacter]MBT2750034.1 hypothetical protein [Lysobacter sp. ISL-50]MBT2783517.1 hypothetical protein [Lysobacter sp. ISL-52]
MPRKHTNHIRAVLEVSAQDTSAKVELIQDHRVTAYDGVTAVHQRGSVVGYCAMTELPTEDWLARTFLIVDHGGAGTAMALAVAERKKQKAAAEQATREEQAPQAAPTQASPEVDEAWPPARAAVIHLDPILEEVVAVELQTEHADNLLWISRLPSSGSVGGWRVRITKGPRRGIRRMFLDKAFGGAAESFACALEFRGPLPTTLRKKSL